MNLKAYVIAWFKNRKINVFFLFLIFSFVTLIFNKFSKQYTNTIGFGIEKINVPQEILILNDSVKLNVTLKTHGFNWLKYCFSKPKIKIDFSEDVYKKEHLFIFNKSKSYLNNTQFAKQVELLNISPDTIAFRYGINTVKKVPVVLNTVINFSPGFDMPNKIIAKPDSITVVGPDVLVSGINELHAESLTLNKVRTNINKSVKLRLPKNTPNLKFSASEIVLQGAVEKFTEGTLKVPVLLVNAPKNAKVKYFPKVVSVSYYVSLKNFNSILPKHFKVVGDFSGIDENQTFFIPKLESKPNAVKNVRIGQKRVEYILVK